MFVKDRAQAKHFVDKQVASELVTMHDGAVEQTAFQFFDDEGTLTGDTVIIDKGILRRGMWVTVWSRSRFSERKSLRKER